jgi:hypothetical protein
MSSTMQLGGASGEVNLGVGEDRHRCMLREKIPSREASSEREYANFGLAIRDIEI